MYKALKKVFKRSLWTMLTVFFGILFAIVLVGANIADGFQAGINGFFGINPYQQVQVGESSGKGTDYYKSDYTKKDVDGNTIYEKDSDNIWHAVYDDEAMRKNSQEVALQAAVEGSVLLWNNGGALPLAENSRVSMFGVSSVNYVFLGDGSGGMSVNPPDPFRNVFPKYGLQYNTDLFLAYTGLVGTYKRGWRNPNEAPWSAVASAVESSVSATDTAVMIISRVAGEQSDILPSGNDTFLDDKNYLDITQDEKDVIDNLVQMRKENKLSKVVLLINSDNAMQFEHIKSLGIDACVWVGQAGTMSYEQIAAVLSGRGDYSVSGKLPDTFAYNNYSAPANVNFGDNSWTESPLIDSNPNNAAYMTNNDKYIVYQEGIYVGYRYYETRYEDAVIGRGAATGTAGVTSGGGAWNYSDEVAYPFGYGGSYTDFTYGDYNVEKNNDGDYEVSLTITNSGTEYSGKEALQVYLQKPYTDYDKNPEHRIEKSAVELVGFAKTKNLAPNERDTLTVTVKAEEFKAYDAYGQKTYILEAGDYYLAVGTNAHDALNNILAAKGYTTAQGMDYNGKAELAHKIQIENDDFVKYNTSTHTGAEITNRFDDADINLYAGTADQKIKYLSRSDWQGTYPADGGVKLKCVNDIMVEDMKYGHPVEAKENDEMPKYEQVTYEAGTLTIAMLMDLEFDDPLWQDLLNQMTVEEQQFLISYGLNNLAGAASVGAPGLLSRDGPAGLKANNPTLKSTFSFPSEVVLAATFDAELVENVGKAFGMEILHAGFTVIYGPGGCIHRSAYSGRNWEYFSEDGVLSGKMLAAETKGLQKYGVIVETKHYALNDTETNRYGIATFANEQAMRDVYLRAFEIAVTEGKMNGVMSSFNRIGCTWSGAHKGLLSDVLRGEWGFDGIVETDSCTGSTGKYVRHMCSIHAKAEGLMAGNDIWMCASGSEEFMIDHKSDHEDFEQSPPSGKITADDIFADVSYLNNPTVMLALRESCHRILYAQLHSNAMNGMDASTRIYKVRVWWQKLLDAFGITFGILTGIFALMAITSFIVNTVWFKEKFRAHRLARADRLAKIKAGEIDDDRFGAMFMKMNKTSKILFYVSISVMVVIITLSVVLPVTLTRKPSDNGGAGTLPVIHVCAHVCEKCGKCTSDCEDEVCADKCQGHPHECESICEICEKCYNLDCIEEVCADKCGHGKKSYVFEAENSVLKDGKKELTIGKTGNVTYVGGINENLGASLTFEITADADTEASLVVHVSRRVMDTVFTDVLYTTVNGNPVSSKAIVGATEDGKEGWTNFVAVNLGCVRLNKGTNTISFAVVMASNYSGYNFDKIELLCDSDLSVYIPHVCSQKCTTCGRCLDLDCEEEACTVHGKCMVEHAAAYKFEAEDAELKNGMSDVATDTADGRPVVTGLNRNNGAAVSFTVFAENDIAVNPVISVSKRMNDVRVSDVFGITVGNTVFTTNAVVPAAGAGVADMSEFANVNLGCMNLKRGKNIVTFAVKTGNDIGFDFDFAEFRAAEEVSATPPDWYVEATEYKFEAENAALAAGSKGLPAKNEKQGVFVVHNLAGNIGAKVTFTIYAEHNAKAVFTAAFAPLAADTKITDVFDIKVNGAAFTSDAVIKGYGSNKTELSIEAILGEIDLLDGADNRSNVIEFTVKSDTNGFNIFDYIVLETTDCETSVEYMPPTPSGHEHTYSSDWTFDDENHWHAGSCEHTFKKSGIAKHSFDANNECTDCGYVRSFKFEAEWGKLGRGDKGQSLVINNNTIVGDINNNTGASISFALYSPEASTQRLFVNITRRKDLKFADGFALYVNRQAVNTDAYNNAMFIAPSNGGSVDWAEYGEVDLGEIELAEGVNYFMLIVKDKGENQGNIDYFKFQGSALVSIADKAEYDGGALIYEAELAELTGGAYIGKPCTTKDGGYKSPLIDGLNGNVGRGMKFTVKSDRIQKVKLIAATTIRNIDIKFNSFFSVYFNTEKTGAPIAIDDSVMLPKDTNAWFTSAEVELGEIELVAGDNTIEFITVGTDGCNFDYIKLVPVTE